ncbi:MAG: ABC transporter permease [bacterium]|nr:ABC transporter permease [bacterium]
MKSQSIVEKIIKKIIPVLFIISLLGIWEAVVRINKIEPYIMPAPSKVAEALCTDFSVLWENMLVTLYEGMLGFVIAIALSLVLAVMIDLIPLLKQAIYPVLVISQTIPTIAIAPLFLIWFGFGILPKVVVVVLVCFFPMVISLVDGMEAVDQELINHFRLMGANKIQRFIHLKLPFGLINFFSGMRIAATYSIMGAIIGEWLGGNKGLGVYMTRAKSVYAIDKMFAAIVLIVAISMIVFGAIHLIEKIATPWMRQKGE